MRLVLIVVVLAAVASVAVGCQELGTASSTTAVAADSATAPVETTATVVSSTTSGVVVTELVTTSTAAETTSTAAATTSTAAPTTTTKKKVTLSAEAIDYAASLGGSSHKGEKLYFVIGTSVKTEAEALDQLEGAKAVGDMQSYFIVQHSSNFEGMNPGWYVVFEAYKDYPSQENIDFCRRPFPGAYVKSAIVRTADPIPVYDDMMGD